jgi:Carboxypeptidase regulatory-like domain/TonB dependent receptor
MWNAHILAAKLTKQINILIVCVLIGHFLLDNDPSSELKILAQVSQAPPCARLGEFSRGDRGGVLMKQTLVRYFLGCSLVAILCWSFAAGQTVTGSITGQVTDPSGALVTSATVTAENVATGVRTAAQTNASGVYTIRFLPIGTYAVTFEASGFSTQKTSPFALDIDQTARINGSLKIGASATVTVEENVHPILDTSDATLGNTLTTEEIASVPLNGRNFSSLTVFQPGAVVTDPTGLTGNNAIERSTYNSGVASINGNRQQGNNFLLEGAEDNEPQNNLIGYNPAPDAIDELKVVSANGNATYGNANGGQIVTVLKSGTNSFHGSAYDLLENQNLDANQWVNGLTNSPITKYTQNIFGGTFGGPIAKNRLFFFADYEGIRKHQAQSLAQTSVLTPEMLQGNFSAFPSQLYDSQNGFAAFTGNQIPVVNPVAIFLAAHPEIYPAPNRTPTDGLIQNNFVGPQDGFVQDNQEDFKVDWKPGDKNAINGFYSQGTGKDFTSAILPVSFPAHNSYPSKIGGGSWVHTFSPAIINEVRVGYTRVRWNNGVPSDPTGLFGLSGESKVGIDFPYAQKYVGFTGQSISNNASYIGTNANPQVFTDNTFNYEDSLTWQHGKHLFTMGAQATRYQQNYLNSGNDGFLGQFSYNGIYTSNPNVASGPGYGPADFVLGHISNTQLASPLGNVGNRQWRVAGYFQDDFKFTSKLTLNIGLRYEVDQPWYEQNNKTANVLPDGTVEYAGHVPAGAVTGSIVCPQRACYDANWKQIMPRLGFAYQINPRTVIRGGYGISSFFEGYSFNQRLTSSPPFSLSINTNAGTPTTTSGGTPFSVGDAFAQPLGINNSTYSVWPQKVQPAFIQQYNLTVEHAITNELSVSLGYHGQSGDHLADYRDGNQLTLAQAPGVFALMGTQGCNGTYPAALQSPYFGLVGECNAVLITESEARMNYSSGQLTVRERTHHGLDFTLNYTWAKSLTNSSGNYAVGGQPNSSYNGDTFQDGYNQNADWGPSAMDIRHSMNFIGVYDLPYGRGRAYGANANGFLDAALGGWKFATTAILYTGFPVTLFGQNNNEAQNSYGFNRANQYRPMIIRNRSLQDWWGNDPSAVPCSQSGVDNGTCAYGNEGTFQFGTGRVGTERAPGYRQVDMSLFKDFHIWEQQVLGFRADFFNIFNIASYSNPDNGINDGSSDPQRKIPGFGLISNVRSPQRQIQLSLHYSF